MAKNQLSRMRGSYAAFVITMSPEDFLKLTASREPNGEYPSDYDRIMADQYPHTRERFTDDRGHDTDFGRFDLPFLTVEYPTGKVKGHEGRHRAAMVMRQGAKAFPVAIMLRHQTIIEVTFSEWRADTDEETDHVEEYTNWQEAEARVKALRDWDNTPEGIVYSSVRTNYRGGGEIKGSPTLADPNNPFNRKAYTKADMPDRLVSQYSDDIAVTNYRVGLVKGYSHFR